MITCRYAVGGGILRGGGGGWLVAMQGQGSALNQSERE